MSRNQYPETDMENAINSVKRHGMSIRAAAKQFNVPRMTLSDKLKGKTPAIRKMGPPSILTKLEEENFVKWIIHLGENGFPVTKEHLLDSVQMLMKKCRRENPFTNDRPGRNWYKAFLRRHPILSQRVSQNLTRTRAGVTETNIANWFNEIKEYLQAKQIFEIVLSSGNRVFNCDETAFFLSPGDNKVLVKKGQKIVHNIVNSDEKECFTTLLMGNADGQIAPPMVVINLKRIPKSFTDSVPSSWAIGRSDNGWMTSQTFYEYFTMVFYPWLVENNYEFPIIVFMDGHVSHLTLPLSEFCSEKSIELIALYPNSTHFLQPMDVAMFHPLKAAWKKEVYNWRIQNSGTRLKRDNFCPLLNKVIQTTCNNDSILKNGFKACGLFPFNPDAIKYFQRKQAQQNTDDTNSKNKKQIIPDFDKILQFIDKHISKEKLQLFKNSDDSWSGDIKDTSLFYFWRNIQEEIRGKIENASQVDTIIQLNENPLDDILGNRNFVEFDMDNGGILKEVENFQISYDEQEEHLETIYEEQTHEKDSQLESNTNDLNQRNLAFVNELEPEDNMPANTSKNTLVTSPTSPQPSSQCQNIPEGIASPFKKFLFWPEVSPKMPRKNKEKIPSVATCEKWKEYHKKKEEKKIQKQNEQEERKRKKLEQKTEKAEKKIKCNTENKENQENESNWYCYICEENIIENMISCMKCHRWCHNRCASVSAATKKFYCDSCKN